MSLYDNVSFSGKGAASRTAEFLERAGLLQLANRRPAEISGGEARRAALARALAPRRDILLLDEPLSNLQLALREQMAAWIGDEIRLLFGQPAYGLLMMRQRRRALPGAP